MKLTITDKKTVNVFTLTVRAGVRYWEDGTINGVEDETGELVPCRNGDYWCPVIDVETGKILNWEEGNIAELHYKVCDDGIYTLKDENGEIVVEVDGYVPEMMCPEENGYGDYIIMSIDENGMIQNWNPNLYTLFDDFEGS